MLDVINKNLNNISLSRAWSLFFIYGVVVSLAIQIIILPLLLPQYHAGELWGCCDGLLAGGDWLTYQKIAIRASHQISEFGWGSWQLRYGGFGLVGVMSAIYSFFEISKRSLSISIDRILYISHTYYAYEKCCLESQKHCKIFYSITRRTLKILW